MDSSDLKCSFAEQVYDEYLQEHYGVEICDFIGYNTLNGKLLDVMLDEYGNCHSVEEVCSVNLCSCGNPCEAYDPYKTCCKTCGK